jgi:hypothetical protein
MDVVVSPAPDATNVWNLTDRLGRNCGQIVRTEKSEFVITPANPRTDGPLFSADAVQPSLNAAIDEIAKRSKGACQFLNGRDT